MLWEIRLLPAVNGQIITQPESPLHDYNGRLFDAAETLAIAIERWIVRKEFREELRKGE